MYKQANIVGAWCCHLLVKQGSISGKKLRSEIRRKKKLNMAINSENNAMVRNEINFERKFREIRSRCFRTVLTDFRGFLNKYFYSEIYRNLQVDGKKSKNSIWKMRIFRWNFFFVGVGGGAIAVQVFKNISILLLQSVTEVSEDLFTQNVFFPVLVLPSSRRKVNRFDRSNESWYWWRMQIAKDPSVKGVKMGWF